MIPFLRSLAVALLAYHCIALYGCTRAGDAVEAVWSLVGAGLAVGLWRSCRKPAKI